MQLHHLQYTGIDMKVDAEPTIKKRRQTTTVRKEASTIQSSSSSSSSERQAEDSHGSWPLPTGPPLQLGVLAEASLCRRGGCRSHRVRAITSTGDTRTPMRGCVPFSLPLSCAHHRILHKTIRVTQQNRTTFSQTYEGRTTHEHISVPLIIRFDQCAFVRDP